MSNNQQTYLQNEIIKILRQNNIETAGKRVYLFAGENATESVVREINQMCSVEMLLDNDRTKHETYRFGKKIVSPSVLATEMRGQFLVLILSRYAEAMGKQLDEIGLRKGTDYLNLYPPLTRYLKVQKFEDSICRFEQFLDRIPEDYFNRIPVTKQHVGVVCLCEMTRYLTVHMLAQALLLRSEGYRVTLIVDALEAFEGYYHFKGAETVTRGILELVLPKLKAKCPDIEIAYVDQEGQAVLNDEDRRHAARMAKYISSWFGARTDIGPLSEYIGNTEFFGERLLHALSYIKSFFENNRFDAVRVYTGFHRHRSMYTYVCNKYGVRICTFDNGGSEKMFHSTCGIAAHFGDTTRMIKEDFFSAAEKMKISQLAKEQFEIRKNSSVHDEGYNYQLIKYDDQSEVTKIYDIVVPLNIAWDSAAMHRDDLFEDYLDWLNQTLRYILTYTNATVMVREHPSQNANKIFFYDNLLEKLPVMVENPNRIFFAAADAQINTYRYLERCKLVLPYTSTTGVEAVMLGKNVILHTHVYYEDIGIAYKASSIEEYFRAISYYLEHTEEAICKSPENAFLAYYYQMNSGFSCQYCMCHMEWLNYTIDELRHLPGVATILDAIGAGIPTTYAKIKEQLVRDCSKNEGETHVK